MRPALGKRCPHRFSLSTISCPEAIRHFLPPYQPSKPCQPCQPDQQCQPDQPCRLDQGSYPEGSLLASPCLPCPACHALAAMHRLPAPACPCPRLRKTTPTARRGLPQAFSMRRKRAVSLQGHGCAPDCAEVYLSAALARRQRDQNNAKIGSEKPADAVSEFSSLSNRKRLRNSSSLSGFSRSAGWVVPKDAKARSFISLTCRSTSS